MKTYIKVLIVAFTAIVSSTMISCERDNPDPGGTATQNLAGEWWVQWDQLPGVYFHIVTYNTSANSASEMWFDDQGTFWEVKGKINTDQNSLSFSGSDIQNVYYDSKFTITEGKVIKEGAKGPVSKSVTDSIYFKISFSDDDPVGTVYTLSGYGRTRYAEDDH
ncbi:lipid-binding protein [Solitalea canadensis]|uniref:Lipid-binding hydrolase n=1 Tax=Solitalea canadensis (strain ATCC 29591 / DSM 3403 / JCM 21819 / LMG 8368 / NBRC 15130 / NCIMB 12057 / USAM 9D) TaxID=929556 RepID=H8KLX5_SOLCM|nr:lipid-binding protein [Solitalea canadensis]AFD08703.1 hypothetical protein Solca_3702 [Solitalea canadensis DSM 3403]